MTQLQTRCCEVVSPSDPRRDFVTGECGGCLGRKAETR